MKAKFNCGDHVTNLDSGEEFVVISLRYVLSVGISSEEYDMMQLLTGAKITVTGSHINRYWPSQNPNRPNGSIPNPISVPVAGWNTPFVDFHIKLPDGLSVDIKKDACDHDWVTWTGLLRTVTDCSKCKKVLTQ